MDTPQPLTLSVPPRLMRPGDVLPNHYGMRLEVIDWPRRVRHDVHDHGGVYVATARVLNRADVPASAVPYSFTGIDGRGEPYPNGEHFWTLQSNDLAPCRIERRPPPPASDRTDADDGRSR